MMPILECTRRSSDSKFVRSIIYSHGRKHVKNYLIISIDNGYNFPLGKLFMGHFRTKLGNLLIHCI